MFSLTDTAALDWSKKLDQRSARTQEAAAALEAAPSPAALLEGWGWEPWRLPRGTALHRAAAHAVLTHAPDLPGTLADLSLLADRVEALERRGWEPAPQAPDRALVRAWEAWFEGDLWEHRELWERRYLRDALEGVRAVSRQLRLPEHAARRALADLEDNFHLVLLGDGSGVAAWVDLALMVVERAPGGPVEGLARCLDEAGWFQLGACLGCRGDWPATLRAVGGERPTTPDQLEALLDLHTLRRVLVTTGGPGGLDLTRAWRVVRANRGRMRGRLRALLSTRPLDGVRARVLRHPSLVEATRQAFARFWFHQAWQELRRDFSFDGRDLATPPCAQPDDDPPAVALDEDALRTWALLVILRGRWDHLQRWAEEGSTGDRDSTWGRLLSDDLPRGRTQDRSAALRAIREHLSMSLGDLLVALLPQLETLARLPPGAGLEENIRGVIAADWHGDVPFPKRGFLKMRANAAALLAGRPVTEEEPWIQPETSS